MPMVIPQLWRRIPWKRLKYPLLLALAVVPGAFLRFFRLGFQSYWFDELITAYWAGLRSLGKVIAAHWSNDVHPPFYQILVWFWAKIFGTGEVALRSFSALMGVLGIVAAYFLGKSLFSKKAGLFAALLVTVNHYHIYYSQEARAYSLTFLLTIVSFLCLVRLLKKPGWKAGVLYALPTLALLYSHYFGYFILASQLVFLFFAFFDRADSRRWLKYAVFSLALIALSLVPWVPALFKMMKISEFWTSKPAPDFFVGYFKAYFGDQPYVLLALTLLFIVYFIKKTGASADFEHHRPLIFLWIFVTLFIPYVRSFDSPAPLNPRYAIVILPALILMAGRALDSLEESRVGFLFLVSLLIMSLIGIFIGHDYYRTTTKQQWREAARYVYRSDPENRYIHCGHYLFSQYLDDLYQDVQNVRNIPSDIGPAAELLVEAEQEKSPGFYVLEVDRFSSMSDGIREYFDKNTRRTLTVSFFRVQASRYSTAGLLAESSKDALLDLRDIRSGGKMAMAAEAAYAFSSLTRLVSQEILFYPGVYALKVRGRIYVGNKNDWCLKIYLDDRARARVVCLDVESRVHKLSWTFPKATKGRLHIEIDTHVLPSVDLQDEVNVRIESLVLEKEDPAQ